MQQVRGVLAMVVGLFALVTLEAQPAGAATVYMGPGEQHTTLRQAFAAMKGGDTLIIRDGVYTGPDNRITWGPYSADWELCPPGGSDGAYTVIRAEHEGKVIFDGGTAYTPIRFTAAAAPFHHVEFHGFVFRNATGANALYLRDEYSTGALTMTHLKFFRCGFFNGVNISGTSYVLLEECYAWGNYRYLFTVGDYDGRGTNKTIFRRCVARPEDVTPMPAGEASGAFMNYSSKEVEYQNCIVIDVDSSKFVNAYNHHAFNLRGTLTNGATPKAVAWRGNIVLNMYGWTMTNTGTYPSGQDLKSTTVGEENHIENCLYWDVMRGIALSLGDADAQAAPGIIKGVTIKLLDDPHYPAAGSGTAAITHYQQPKWTLRNYLAIGNTPPLGSMGALVSGMFSNYGAIYTTAPGPTNADWSLYNNGGPGTHDYTQATTTYQAGMTHPANNEVNPFTGTPGNGTPALKYIVRVEPGSDLYSTGENGAHRGATVTKRYGVSGSLWGDPGWNTLTDEDLWPFPYEAQIRADLRTYSIASDPNFGKRGFAADGQTLTNYIWGYLGHTVPPLGVTATPGDGSITLTWAPPADVAKPTISGYNIYRLEGLRAALVGEVKGNATHSVTARGLDASRYYVFALTALDSKKGESGLSSAITARPAQPAGTSVPR